MRAADLSPYRVEDHTEAHAEVARRLVSADARYRVGLRREFGDDLWRETTLAHRRWAEWPAARRVRKLAIVTARPPRLARYYLNKGWDRLTLKGQAGVSKPYCV